VLRAAVVGDFNEVLSIDTVDDPVNPRDGVGCCQTNSNQPEFVVKRGTYAELSCLLSEIAALRLILK